MDPDLSQIDFRLLRALCAVARRDSFQGAADELGYTQSAVSQQIATLERAVGAQLITRPGGRRPVVLTEAGGLLRAHAEAISARLEIASADLRGLAEGSRGRVQVGIYPSIVAPILAAVLGKFTAVWPNIEVVFEESVTDEELQRLVACGELDAAFAILPARDSSLVAVELLEDPYVLVVRNDDALAKVGHLRLEHLVGRQLAAFKSCPHQTVVDEQLRACGMEPGIGFRSDSNDLLLKFAADGIAAALVTELVAARLEDSLTVVPAGHLFPSRRIGLVTHPHRRLSPASAHFVDTVLEVCSDADFRAGRRRLQAVKPTELPDRGDPLAAVAH
jgi:DNA-binding transcriptional LysR family regulator